jgi:hypothetical protein
VRVAVLAYDRALLSFSNRSRDRQRVARRPTREWLLFAVVCAVACGGSPAATSPAPSGDASTADASTADASTADALATDVAITSATDGSPATPDGALPTPPGYVTVLVPHPDGPCALPTACGGDVTGTWVLVSECNRYPDNNWPEATGCNLGGIVQATVWEAKTLTFSSGGANSGTTDRLEGFEFAVPSACLSTTPCSQFAALLQASVDAYSVTASCNADSQGNCTCTEVAPDPTLSGSFVGTYQVSGTEFSTGSGSAIPYCVSGSQLTYFNPGGDWVYTYQKQ